MWQTMLLYFKRLSYTYSLCFIFCSLKVICLGVGVLLIINFAFLNFSLVFSKLSRSMIWCVNNVGNFSHHCFKYFFSILLFLLLNCYSYVHITHFNIVPQFLDVFLFFLFTFIFVWFIQIYLQVQRHSLFLLLSSISSISFCFYFGVSISAYVAHPFLPLEYLTHLLLLIEISCLFIYVIFKPSLDYCFLQNLFFLVCRYALNVFVESQWWCCCCCCLVTKLCPTLLWHQGL